MIHAGRRTLRLLTAVSLLLAGCGGGTGPTAPDGDPGDVAPDRAVVDASGDLDAPQEVAADAAPEQVGDVAPEQVGVDGISPEDVLPAPDVVEIVDPLPEVHIDTPAPGFVRGTVEVAATAFGDPEVVKVRFLVDGGLLLEDDAVPYQATWDTTEFDDGDHELEAVAFDAAEGTASALVLVTVDNTIPDVEFLSPAPGELQHDEILLSVEATDNFQMDRVDFWVDSGGDIEEVSEAPWELLFDGSELVAGLHTAFASAVDAAGNESGVTMQFLVDRPPAVAILAPAPGATVAGPVTVQVAADDDLGLQGVALHVDGEWEAALAPAGDGAYETEWVPAYEKGERLLSVSALDGAGQEAVATVTVLVDHPVSVVVQICADGLCEVLQADTELTGPVQLRAVAEDDGGAIVGVDFLVDGEQMHQDLAEPFDFPWDTTGVADGARLLEAVATTTLDEAGTAQVQVLVNNCDLDHDDFTSATCGGPDCDDGDATISPAASDLVGNDADENCDGMDGVDADGDGYASTASGGDDCDDGDDAVHPCADDPPDDGVDANCDGEDALACDDCNPCTVDSWIMFQCVHAPYPDGAPCDDEDLCTDPGTCQDEVCLVGPSMDCDDDNPCTEDGCVPDAGCFNLPLDGDPCGAGTCQEGTCCVPACDGKECGPDGCGSLCGVCAEEQECSPDGQCVEVCTVAPFADVAMKITTLEISEDAHPGTALDIDGDPATCAPVGNCSGGMHNQLAGLLGQVEQFIDFSQELQAMVDSGELVLLADFEGFNLDGAPFVMRMFSGEALLPQAECDWQTGICPFLVDHEDFDPESCEALMWFDNAVVVDGKLHAGGVGYSVQMTTRLPSLSPGTSVDVSLWFHDARLEGDVIVEDGQVLGLADVIFGAAITKQSLIDWVDALPEETFPVENQMVKNLLDMFIIPDIDVDGDGTQESASIAVHHDAIRAELVGLTEPPACEPECLPWQVCAEAEGACVNPEDLAIIEAQLGSIEVAVGQCGWPCMWDLAPDLTECLLPCLVETTGLSEACAVCFPDRKYCILDNCSQECVFNDDTPECIACKEAAGCDAAFDACTGFVAGIPVETGCQDLPPSGPCAGGGVAVALDCHGTSSEGCCGGTDLYYCEDSSGQCPGGAAECLCKAACGNNDPVCDWLSCDPDCAGKECGADGCGGSCGECPCDGCGVSETVCADEGVCVLTPGWDFAELGIRILGPDAQGWGQQLGSKVSVTGMAVGGPEEILWETGQGASGSASLEEFWATGPISFVQGDNTITVTAIKGQETASDSVVLTYNPAFLFGKLHIRPGGLFVGETSILVFRIGMGMYNNFTPSTLTLSECNPNGEWLGDVHVMQDNGSVSNSGDEIQQDGVYSWRQSYSPDAPGPLCFRVHATVSAGYQQYEAWSPVTCVEVVEHLTQVQCEAAKALQEVARVQYDAALELSGAPVEAQQAVLSWLEGVAGVVEAGPASGDGYGVWLRHSSGILGALALAPDGLRGGEVPLLSHHTAVLSPFHADFSETDEGLEIQSMLEQSSCPYYSSDGPLLDGQAGLAAWRHLSDHGLAAVVTHGDALFLGLDDAVKTSLGWHHKGTQELLWTGETVDCDALLQGPQACAGPGDCPQGSECVITQSTGQGTSVSGTCVDWTQIDLVRGRIVMGTDRYAVLPSFVKHYQGHGYPKSLVYLGACRSMYNGSLGMELFAAGARAIAGYTGYVTSAFAFDQGVQLFTGLLQEHELSGEAMPPAQEDPDNPGSGLFLLGAENLDVSRPELINSSWESGDLKGWLSDGDARVVTRLGTTGTVEGKYTALISTGTGYTPQSGEISQDFCIPAGKTELSFYWKFYSEEFKEWCGSSFLDSFQASLETEDGAVMIVDVDVDALCAPSDCPGCGGQFEGLSQADVSFDQGGVWMTPWQKATVNVTGFSGLGPVTLRFVLSDLGDSLYDSVVLVDAVKIK